MTRLSCDGPTLIRSVAAAVANLERHVAEVDALNVFPVPDGDTGSNMLATLRAALAEAERLPAEDRQLGPVADALARGAIRGARGNSGVILAEIIRGMTSGVDGRHRATGIELAAGLRHATESAYGSVLEPVEGTILTVIRDAAEAAETEATRHRHVERVLSAAVVGAARSVDRTPGLLAVLADAGVVDSGGQGLLRILEGTLLLDGSERQPATLPPSEASEAPARVTPDTEPAGVEGHFGYETVYVVESPDGGLDVERLRTELHTLGESIVVAGDRRLARVHIHGPRPDLAIAVGLRLGRISDVSITDLDADAAGARHEAPAGAGHAPTVPLGLVAFADADGGASLLARIQVGGVVRPALGRAPSAVEVAAAVAATHGRHVLVLVRDPDDARALDEALDLVPGVEVTAVPVGDIAGAVAAALAFDPNAPASENAERMGAEARRLRRVELGSDEAVDVVIQRMRAYEGDGIEVATVYAGDRLPPAVEDALRAAIVAAWPGVEIDVVFAGQHGDSALVALD